MEEYATILYSDILFDTDAIWIDDYTVIIGTRKRETVIMESA